jgi:uncharacterized protein YbbC (DUF1343 family)
MTNPFRQMNLKNVIFYFACILPVLCIGNTSTFKKYSQDVYPGAYQTAQYIPGLKGKNIACVVNQTSMIGQTHLVDTLIKHQINITKVFAPEHGFRGFSDAGETIPDDIDTKTGIPLVSLYGKRKKPSNEDLQGIDMVVFDIQDVGVRFYTFLSTLHYVMEACAENNIPLLVLDRANPNGHYIDGPVLEKPFASFVGMHPVPVVYGMTIGEYARMINGEGWLAGQKKCDLTVIPCKGYHHNTSYVLPVKPSPNLPNELSILLYPGICMFEGTTLSLGRGTEAPFQMVGHPDLEGEFSFTPRSVEGAKSPPQLNILCKGTDLRNLKPDNVRKQKRIHMELLLKYHRELKSKNIPFFLENLFFDKLAGTDKWRKLIEQGATEKDIRKSWENDLKQFSDVRKKYLIYP